MSTATNSQTDYQCILEVNASPAEAFAIINNVPAWWNDTMTGCSTAVGDEFSVRFADIHQCTQRIIRLLPAKLVEWLVVESRLNFIEPKDEWTNTRMLFELEPAGAKTNITFTHIGLQPTIACFNSCSKGWDYYLKESLLPLLNGGAGKPGLP